MNSVDTLIDVYEVNLRDSPADDELRCLSAEELLRFNRFACSIDQNHFAIPRIALRHLLAQHLQCAPAAVELSKSASGKPILLKHPGEADLRFNVCHAGDVGLIALTTAREVGIDIETFPRRFDWRRAAGTMLSSSEKTAIEELSADHRPAAMLRCVTARQSISKAMGIGPRQSSAEVDVAGCLQGGEAVIHAGSREYRVLEVRTGQWIASVAVEGNAPAHCRLHANYLPSTSS